MDTDKLHLRHHIFTKISTISTKSWGGGGGGNVLYKICGHSATVFPIPDNL